MPKTAVFEIWACASKKCWTKGHSDMVIGLNVGSWRVDMSFDYCGHRKLAEFGKKNPKSAIFRKMSLYGLELLNGRSYRISYSLKWQVLMWRCAFWQFRPNLIARKWPNLVKIHKSFDFSNHEHIRNIQYPFESEAVGALFVFHKYFLVYFCFGI